MSVLDNIKLAVVPKSGVAGLTENALPLLHEIRHALRRLADFGESTTIDLRAIPFGPGDEDRLLSELGEGEVSAKLNALGETLIRETRYSGVWLIDHRNPEDERVALQIEITRIPGLLKAQKEDIADSLEQLQEVLTTNIAE